MHLEYKINIIANAIADLLDQVFPVQQWDRKKQADDSDDQAGRRIKTAGDSKRSHDSGKLFNCLRRLFPRCHRKKQADGSGDQTGRRMKTAEHSQRSYDSGKLSELLRQLFPLSPEKQTQPDQGMGAGEALWLKAGGLEHHKIKDKSGRLTKSPLDRLIEGFGLSRLEENLIILAGITHEHEAVSEIFRMLNPYNKPYPTVALAAQLFCKSQKQRSRLRRALATGPGVKNGMFSLDREKPFYERNLYLMPKLWPVLRGIDLWPPDVEIKQGTGSCAGLSGWFKNKETRDAILALERAERCYIMVTEDGRDIAFERACSLVENAGLVPAAMEVGVEKAKGDLENQIVVHATARDVIPVINIRQSESVVDQTFINFNSFPGPLVIASDSSIRPGGNLRPLIRVQCHSLSIGDTASMWEQMIPELSEHAGKMAVRYPVEPAMASKASMDLGYLHRVSGRKPCLSDLDYVIRGRTCNVEASGIQRVRPKAGWQHLVLPKEKKQQLYEARDRILHQIKVLDQWEFLKDRRGAYGVRMLFSGPSGTGKTLTSEVMANELGLELLIIDLSRVVSKWIGETEKNLSRIFQVAEQTRAVLLFDEADALFGKRTEVSDAHDRYANLETAYLLARLEQYEGLAILTTNFRQNIDTAFMRRLEFVIEFETPDKQQRLSLWETHIPDKNLLHKDVNLAVLASFYSMTGAMIRNAAVGAAFLAAAQGDGDGPITRDHMIKAIRREYAKSGKAFPGLPPGMNII